MQAKLFCKTGPLAGTSFDVNKDASIGKNAANSIRLTSNIISGQHARISFDEKRNAFFIEDLGSTNGTWVDGVRIRGKERLDSLHVVTFADSLDFIFQVVGQKATDKKEPVAPHQKERPGTVLDADPVPTVKPPPAKNIGQTAFDQEPIQIPQLKPEAKRSMEKTAFDQEPIPMPQLKPEAKKGMDKTAFDQEPISVPKLEEKPKQSNQGTQFEQIDGYILPTLQPEQTPIARSKNATVFDPGGSITQSAPVTPPEKMEFVLEVKGSKGPVVFDVKEGENIIGREHSCTICIEDASVSRKHACITMRSGHLTITDLGSKNGTTVGKKTLSAETTIGPGDELTFGNITARLSGKSTR